VVRRSKGSGRAPAWTARGAGPGPGCRIRPAAHAVPRRRGTRRRPGRWQRRRRRRSRGAAAHRPAGPAVVPEAHRRAHGPGEPVGEPAKITPGGPQLVQQLLRPGAGPAVRLLERRAPVRSAGHVPLSSPPCRPGLTHRHVTRTRRAPAPGTAPPAAGGDGPPAEMPRPGPGGGLGRLTGRMPRKPGSTPPLHEAVRRGRPPPRRRAPRAGRCRATGRRRSRAARLSALCCLRSGRPCSVGRETGALTLPGFMRRAAWAPSRRAWTRRRPAMHARRPLTA
jgi:hypothetical protein